MELLGRYSRWAYWADRTRPLLADVDHRPTDPVPARRVARRLSEQEVDALVLAYDRGATCNDLAAQLQLSRTTVLGHLHRRGVAMRNRGLDADQQGLAIRLYEDGWSMARIGERFGVTGHTVLKTLRAEGVRTRDSHGRER